MIGGRLRARRSFVALSAASCLLLVSSVAAGSLGASGAPSLDDARRIVPEIANRSDASAHPARFDARVLAFDSEYRLTLERNDALYGEGYAAHRWDPATRSLGRSAEPETASCRYVGTASDGGSFVATVAINACDGVSGHAVFRDHVVTFEPARGGDGEETPDGRPRDPLAVPLVVVRHDRRAPSVSDSDGPSDLAAAAARSSPSRRGREGAPADVARSSRGLDALDVPPSPRPPSRRRLRSAHADYVLEMLVVNDHARVSAYGGDAAAMHADSLDVVNAVSAHYAKLTPPIEVRISKQVDFESGDPYESSVTYAGSETSYTSLITEFNSYLVDAAGELGDQHDVAHLFSMRDFQYGLEGYSYEDVQVPYTGPGGLAAGVVCKVGSFGAISMVYKTRADGWRNRELEISSATVTHETGHQFGMLHDGQNSGCGGNDQDGDTYLMNGYYVTPTRWSSCSQDVITRNLDAFACMAPSETAGPPPPTPPGSPPLSTNEEIEVAFVDAGEGVEEAAVVVKETGDGGLLAAVIVLFVVLVYFVALNVWQHALLNPEGCAAGCCVILVGAERFRSAQDAPRTWRRCSCFGGAAEAPAAAEPEEEPRRRRRGLFGLFRGRRGAEREAEEEKEKEREATGENRRGGGLFGWARA